MTSGGTPDLKNGSRPELRSTPQVPVRRRRGAKREMPRRIPTSQPADHLADDEETWFLCEHPGAVWIETRSGGVAPVTAKNRSALVFPLVRWDGAASCPAVEAEGGADRCVAQEG